MKRNHESSRTLNIEQRTSNAEAFGVPPSGVRPSPGAATLALGKRLGKCLRPEHCHIAAPETGALLKAELRTIRWRSLAQPIVLSLLAGFLAIGSGCAGGKREKKKDEFFTSGSREADQRASQKMAQAEQLSGEGEGGGEKGVKKAKAVP